MGQGDGVCKESSKEGTSDIEGGPSRGLSGERQRGATETESEMITHKEKRDR